MRDGMPGVEVARVVAFMEEAGFVYQVNGGWAVDALLGRQTRVHGDLDVFLDTTALPTAIDWLERRRYRREEDQLPSRLEMRRGDWVVDLHPMQLDDEGNGRQEALEGEGFIHRTAERTTGSIAGQSVTVATPGRLIELHDGYTHRDADIHDLELLRSLL
jgi:lincosamide nucleotidyltransferase A/C/D/E